MQGREPGSDYITDEEFDKMNEDEINKVYEELEEEESLEGRGFDDPCDCAQYLSDSEEDFTAEIMYRECVEDCSNED